MKKFLCLMLSLLLALSALTACGEAEPSTPTTQAPTQPPVETTVPAETLAPDPEALRNNLPIMDGSTSLIPLEAGLRAALFGKTIEEATLDVSHTTSWGSFYNLLDGTVDLVFSVPLSEEQRAIAGEQGVALETVPIAMEGFVFVVNAENPVDSLTQQQIKDIYSGKITNWSEVGGLDEEIIPYQRNTDSGSQNYMIEFMGDTPLLDAPTELRPASMSGLMDVIAVNDNSRAAIGYSVYAYAADMYGNGNEIKFIQVDGVAPSKAAFADGTYPLMGYNYAVFRADEPRDSYVRQLVAWMLSAEGQTAIAEAGYVTVVDVGYDYTEATLTKYEGIGSGAPAGAVPSSEYILTDVHYSEWSQDTYTSQTLELTEETTPEGYPTWHITQLADKTLQAEINAWIDSQMGWVAEEQADMEALVDQLNQHYDYGPYQVQEGHTPCTVTAKNGYLSVVVALRYWKNGNDEHFKYYRTETATWDLLTGEKLTTEDLFCQGVDIDQVLNTYIQEYTQMPRREFSPQPEMVQDFVSLPDTGWHVTPDAIYIDHSNPDFVNGEKLPLDQLPDGTLITEQLREFSQCLDPESAASTVQQFRISTRDIYYAYNADGTVSCSFLDETVYPSAAAINDYVKDYLDTYFTKEGIRKTFAGMGYTEDRIDMSWMDWVVQNWGGHYLYFSGSGPVYYHGDDVIRYPYPNQLLFDLETGEEIAWKDLLKDGWEEAVQWEDGHAPYAETDAPLRYLCLFNGESLSVQLIEDGEVYSLTVPSEYIIY